MRSLLLSFTVLSCDATFTALVCFFQKISLHPKTCPFSKCLFQLSFAWDMENRRLWVYIQIGWWTKYGNGDAATIPHKDHGRVSQPLFQCHNPSYLASRISSQLSQSMSDSSNLTTSAGLLTNWCHILRTKQTFSFFPWALHTGVSCLLWTLRSFF